MADLKFSALADLPVPDPADVLPIIDIAPTPTSKKITVANLLAAAPGGGSAGTGWVSLTDAATITSDALSNPRARFEVILTANRILAVTSNLIDGATITYRFRQDSTGSRTITLASGFIVPTDITVTLSTGANLSDFMTAIYHAGTGKLVVLALTKGAAL